MRRDSEKQRTYISIDLKSFYASVECIKRGLDPMTTNLVVADISRTEKTICLAVSPSMKAYGISGRARLFEVIQKVRQLNNKRRYNAPGRKLTGESCNSVELEKFPDMAISYITAPPRMALYMDYSTKIYSIYLKYVAPEDIHVYSIDEVFMDVTDYLDTYKMSDHDLAMRIIKDVLNTTGITATAGIGTNLYLAKIAMDIVAKHIPADKSGVRIAKLDEMEYRRLLWDHRPITDFWRVGKGYAGKLAANGIYTMGDIARCSVGKPENFYNEELLYRMFGVNAELLIDHAWGWEPVGMADIKAYEPETRSIGSGQVLHDPYTSQDARMVVFEMADMLALDLVDKGMVTNQLVMTIGYDIENLSDPDRRKKYKGSVTTDQYGRRVPKHAHGTVNLECYTSSSKIISESMLSLYDRIVDANLLVRRINLSANRVVREALVTKEDDCRQLDFFTDYETDERQRKEKQKNLEEEKQLQHAMLDIKKKFGKNALLKGTSLQQGATARQRNNQIGGHKA